MWLIFLSSHLRVSIPMDSLTATLTACSRLISRLYLTTTVYKPHIIYLHRVSWTIHRLAYRRTNHKNLHVRGYKEKGNINTPLDLAILNQTDRFSLAIDVIDRVP